MSFGERKGTIRNLRWWICGLLFFGIAINYLDRQVFTILAPDLQDSIHWSELDYARMVMAFQLAFGVSFLFGGWLIDKIGVKTGLVIAVVWWSVAETGHAFARTVGQFAIARFLLAIGESASFPASVKAIGEWFPKRERSLAIGIINGAATAGAVGAPIVITVLRPHFGWPGVFVGTGIIGLVWLLAWLMLYAQPDRHALITSAERELIESDVVDSPAERISWIGLLRYRQLWAYAVGRILTDPVYWFFLYWLPKMLAREYGVRGAAAIPYLTVVYMFTGIGSILGGLGSTLLIGRGWSVNAARKTTFIVLSSIAPVVIFAAVTHDAWTAVILIGLLLAAHQGWSTNNFTMIVDLFPRGAVASVFGIGAFLGVMGSILAADITGRILDYDPNLYLPMFIYTGLAYLVATFLIQLLVPDMKMVDGDDRTVALRRS